MKRFFSALGLAALLQCTPAEEEVSPVSTQTGAVQQQEPKYPANLDVIGKLIYSDFFSAAYCDGTVMYLEKQPGPIYAAFCFPYFMDELQVKLLESNQGGTFHCEGPRVHTETLSGNKPAFVELPSNINKGLRKLPLYHTRTIVVQRDSPSHIELEAGRSKEVKEEEFRQGMACPNDLSRYFVEFQGTFLTVCADQLPTDGLAHRIDYRKDEIGQPTYRVE